MHGTWLHQPVVIYVMVVSVNLIMVNVNLIIKLTLTTYT